jgi:hypothetical protein
MVRGYNLSPWPTSSLNVTTPKAKPNRRLSHGLGNVRSDRLTQLATRAIKGSQSDEIGPSRAVSYRYDLRGLRDSSGRNREETTPVLL